MMAERDGETKGGTARARARDGETEGGRAREGRTERGQSMSSVSTRAYARGIIGTKKKMRNKTDAPIHLSVVCSSREMYEVKKEMFRGGGEEMRETCGVRQDA